jgi:molecular chaperone GrpE
MPGDNEPSIDLNNSESDNDPEDRYIHQETQAGDEAESVSAEISDPLEQIQQLKLELDEYKDLYLRKAADFENFRKRKQLEASSLARNTEEIMIASLLPILDDFERLFSNAAEEQLDPEAPFLRGARLIYDKMINLLTARGLKPLEAMGQPFDPDLHEAIMQQPQSGVEPGIVLQEFARGWRLGDKVIRHAKVVVSSEQA